jgi:hypothetical protein
MRSSTTSPGGSPIILLDLNYTLVANNPPRGTTSPRMAKRLEEERYRQWLVELVRPHTVILVTARPDRWKEATLDRIEQETGWRPDHACFAPRGWWNPPAIKDYLLKKEIFPVHGDDARYIAIESNPRTREIYARFGIPCFWVTKEGTSLTDGTRIVKRLPR